MPVATAVTTPPVRLAFVLARVQVPPVADTVIVAVAPAQRLSGAPIVAATGNGLTVITL